MQLEQKQKYVESMKDKAAAYAQDVLSDIKPFMPKDDYQQSVRDFAQAFLCGADAAIATIKEMKEEQK